MSLPNGRTSAGICDLCSAGAPKLFLPAALVLGRLQVLQEAWTGAPLQRLFFWLGAAWVKPRAERPSVSEVNYQLHVQIGCKLRIRNRKDELTKQARRNKLRIKPEGNSKR